MVITSIPNIYHYDTICNPLVIKKWRCYSIHIGGMLMAESVLVNRKKFISSLDKRLVEPFDELSKKTRVPKSRLLDEAIEDLLKKYKKRDG